MSFTDGAILAVVVVICITIAYLIKKRGVCIGCSRAGQCNRPHCPVAEGTVKDMEKRLEDLDR